MPHWRGDWGERETFVPSTPPWLTLTHSQGYLFLLSAKKYFERPFAAYTLGVSGKVQSLKGWPQDSLLRSWRATNHGPLPFLAHRRIWLKIVASQQKFGKQIKFSAWKLGIKQVAGNLGSQISCFRQTSQPAPAIFLCSDNKQTHHDEHSSTTQRSGCLRAPLS